MLGTQSAWCRSAGARAREISGLVLAQGDKLAEVARAALHLQRATTRALSQEALPGRPSGASDDGDSVYASPSQSMTPRSIPFPNIEVPMQGLCLHVHHAHSCRHTEA